MDPFEDTLRRLREAFGAGLTRPAEFRASQLKALGRFLQDNRELLRQALAQDLQKVGGQGEAGGGLGTATPPSDPTSSPGHTRSPAFIRPSFLRSRDYLLRTYCVPGTVPGPGGTIGIKRGPHVQEAGLLGRDTRQ